MRNKERTWFQKVTAAGLLLFAVYLLWCVSLGDDVIWERISVNGVSICGMTKAEAAEAIREQFRDTYQDVKMTIRMEGREYEAYIYPILDIDPSGLIEEAYALGHGAWFTRGLHRLQRMGKSGGQEEAALYPVAANPEKTASVIAYTEIEKLDTSVETTCQITDTSLILRKGKSGVKADTEALAGEILAAIGRQDYEAVIDCPLIQVQPQETDLQEYYDRIFQEPENAWVDEENEYQVVPSADGVSFDLEEAKARFRAAGEGELVIIDLIVTRPEVTTQEISGTVCGDVLGSYVTYGGGTENRIANLMLAAEACDGIVLMPGEVFSYNDTLGERTEEKGYRSAGVFVNGQHAEDIGGGICQVSTTLFVACLYSDLEIVERSNHSGRVDYVPEGLDAAVSWGGQDFRFRNNTAYPIRISAAYSDGSVNVKIYGTKVEHTTVQVYVEQRDAQSYVTFRSVYDGDGSLLKTEEIGSSHYMS